MTHQPADGEREPKKTMMTEDRKNELRERVRRSIEESRSRLMDFARRNNRGGCKILSEGDRCTCLLCDITTLFVNATITNECSDSAALTAAAEQLREKDEELKRLKAQNSDIERVRHGLAKIYECNEKFHWKLVDLIEPGAGGVSPLHFVEEGIKKLQSQLAAAQLRLAAAERLLDRAWVAKQSFWYFDEVCIFHPFFQSGWMARKNPLLIGRKGTTGAEALSQCDPHQFNGWGFDNPVDAYLAAVAANWLPTERKDG